VAIAKWLANSTMPFLTLRASELDLGLWLFKTTGNPAPFSPLMILLANQNNWFVREVLGMMRRN